MLEAMHGLEAMEAFDGLHGWHRLSERWLNRRN